MNDKTIFNKVKLLRSWGRSSSLFDENNSETIENEFNINLMGLNMIQNLYLNWWDTILKEVK